MSELQVIDDPSAAVAALDPVRSQLLAELASPASAANLAARLGLPRQKANYHLRALEAHGLVRIAEERHWGGLTERLLVASADGYLVSPSALGRAGADPNHNRDRLSASYMLALAGRTIREVGALLRLAERTGKRLAAVSLDSDISFKSPADRAAFAEELTAAVSRLAAKYHDDQSPGARTHRLVVALHPVNDSAD